MQYRRDNTPGGTYFFTVVLFRRWPWFNDARYVAHLRQAFADEKARRPFEIHAIVVMPDHLHTQYRKNGLRYGLQYPVLDWHG